jgi:NADH-quinone oxidoreductase subunit F
MGLSAETQEKIRAEQGRFPNPRGALLAALYLARDDLGALGPQAFAELAPLFGMHANEVAEVASFYSLFNLPRAQAVIQVCTNLPCCLRGARGLVRELERRLAIKAGTATSDGRFAIAEVECLGACATAPVLQVNRNPYLENVTMEFAASLLESPEVARAAQHPAPIISRVPDGVDGYLIPRGEEKWLTLDDYRAHGGFEAVRKAGAMTPKDLVQLVRDSNLRGRGGAGFVTGLKWSFMPPRDARPRYLAVNADESEPGTFKDRQIMSRNPFLPLEGIMIAAMAMESTAAFIYIRGEYIEEFAAMSAAIRSLYEARILGENALAFNRRFDITIQQGAGAYICGEESGMLESMEGRKGQPRKRPPFPAQVGLWGQPTTVDNVETLAHVPAIVVRGAQWFLGEGVANASGHTLFGVSGHVSNPGIFELRLGVKLRDLIYKYAGGVPGDRPIKAVIPGGVSMPVLRGDQIDVAMDHESLRAAGTLIGTGGVIVMDDRTCMVRAALVVARFFEHESCGQCTQCREGTGWTYRTLRRIENGEGVPQDLQTLADTFDFMDGKCICALADGASWAARAFLKQFRADFEAHIAEHRCPFPKSFDV